MIPVYDAMTYCTVMRTYDEHRCVFVYSSTPFNDMHEKKINRSDSSSDASEASDTDNDASTVQEATDVDSPDATSQAAESSIEQAVSTSGECSIDIYFVAQLYIQNSGPSVLCYWC